MIKNRIREYRARFDMKQEDLAARVGVRRETIGNLEKGRYNPSLVLAWNIAKVFGVPIEEVFLVMEDSDASDAKS
ncbi:helix-turn-helix domain-containing protein [Beduinella massiliensis]|uniref:helix-turn-helix domain-containing protein n=1 Tax=Beduinella massiliensis TaxID=1852363 RepID=UPI000C837CD1